MKKLFFITCSLLLCFSCSNEDTSTVISDDTSLDFAQYPEKINSSNFPILYDLIDSNHKVIGTMEILDDTDNLYVSCKFSKNISISEAKLFAGKAKDINEEKGLPDLNSFSFNALITNPTNSYSFTIEKNKIALDANECVYFSLYTKLLDVETSKTIQGWSSSQILPGTERSKLVLYCVRNESIAINIP